MPSFIWRLNGELRTLEEEEMSRTVDKVNKDVIAAGIAQDRENVLNAKLQVAAIVAVVVLVISGISSLFS